MISDKPMIAADSTPGLRTKVKQFIVAAKAAAADGLTWVEFGELLVALLKVTIATVDAYGMATGAEKKAMVMEAAGLLFDAVADKAVPLALWPIWLVVRPAVRSLVLALASGAVEIVLPMVRSAR
jgi:hypothetical protein